MRLDSDVLELCHDGPMTLAECMVLRRVLDEVRAELGHCFMLVDMHRGTSIEPEARKYMAEWSKDPRQKLAGAAVYGVSFGMRTISTLMINAIKLMGKLQTEVMFAKDETDARRWIAEQRALQFPKSSP